MGQRDGGYCHYYCDPGHHIAEPESAQKPDHRERHRSPDASTTLCQAEARGARIGREYLRGEDLHRVAGQLDEEVHPKADDQNHHVRSRIEERDRHDDGEYECGDRGPDPAEAFKRIHHEEAAQREGKLHPEGEGQGLGDREAAISEDVRQPAAETQGGAKECEKADHRGDDALPVSAEHDTHRIAADVAARVGDELVGGWWPAEAHAFEEIERPPAMTVGDEPPRRLGQRKAQGKYDQSAEADDHPDPTPADRVPKAQRKERTDRPDASATDELHEGGGSPADPLG